MDLNFNGSFVYLDTDFFFFFFLAVLGVCSGSLASPVAVGRLCCLVARGILVPQLGTCTPILEGRCLATGQLDKPQVFLFNIHNGT